MLLYARLCYWIAGQLVMALLDTMLVKCGKSRLNALLIMLISIQLIKQAYTMLISMLNADFTILSFVFHDRITTDQFNYSLCAHHVGLLMSVSVVVLLIYLLLLCYKSLYYEVKVLKTGLKLCCRTETILVVNLSNRNHDVVYTG